MLGGDLPVCLDLVKQVVERPGYQEINNSEFTNSKHESHIDVYTNIEDINEHVKVFMVQVKVTERKECSSLLDMVVKCKGVTMNLDSK